MKLEDGTGGVGTQSPLLPSLLVGPALGHSACAVSGSGAGLTGHDSLVMLPNPMVSEPHFLRSGLE